MARSLPLESPADSITPTMDSAQVPRSLTGTITVFDPAMCCSTGVCGPGVDPAIMTIARDLRWLEKHGVAVQRHGLAQQPDEFVSNARISGLMQAFGDEALPAVLVNDVVLCYGRYPSRDELTAALTPSSDGTTPAPDPSCTPGSGCC